MPAEATIEALDWTLRCDDCDAERAAGIGSCARCGTWCFLCEACHDEVTEAIEHHDDPAYPWLFVCMECNHAYARHSDFEWRPL